jgi:Zn-dependent membrane protease YugP
MPIMFFSPSYLAIMLIGAVVMGWAQWRVRSAYGRFSKVSSRSGLTGAQVARRLLDADRLFDVSIERTSGKLDDHYDPRERVLRLSPDVHDGNSLASIGVAAHEMGHALQHAEGYAPLSFRQAFYPVASFSSRSWPTLLMIGFILGVSPLGKGLLIAAAVALGIYSIFALVTLPVEFNASRRALVLLEGSGTLNGEELDGARKVLSAAGLTYVASAFQTLLTLFYVLSRARN